MTIRRYHKGIYAFESLSDDGEAITIPEDLSTLDDAALDESSEDSLVSQAIAVFDAMFESNPQTAEELARLDELALAIEGLRSERTARESARAEVAEGAAALRERIHGTAAEAEVADDAAEGEPAADDAPAADKEPALVASGDKPRIEFPQRRRLNYSLAEVRSRAPKQEARSSLAITAAADVPRFTAGHEFITLAELSEAVHERAKTTPLSLSGNTDGPKVATIHKTFKHVVGRDTSPQALDEMIRGLTNPETLVAAGGWCAPSEVTYEFFDITCEDGMIDLPDFGVTRGGIRFPVSPTLADVFTGSLDFTTNPWLWTETTDQATVTGSPNKPCVRVPCPSFTDVRLECFGICLTAGNLTDSAFPEATRHQLGLLRSAQFHAMNQRHIAAMVALSTNVGAAGFFDDARGAAGDLLAATAWAAVDYRHRFGMCETAVLEVVLPAWAKEVIRADLSFRTGIDLLAVSDSQINDYFDVRGVRVQWVKDWQVRGSNQPGGTTPTQTYPGTAEFLIYAAGTFARGNGMTLDLGVVRDSVLNAENDHTAAWMEECHLIAQFGPSSRRYTVSLCAAGRTGSANITGCATS